MAVTKLQTRIALKYDSYSNWTSSPGKDLVLLPGEIGICEIASTNVASEVAPTVLFKVGNGTKTFEALPWASAKAADVYSWAKASNVVVDGKNIKFIGGAVDENGNKIDKIITLNFATPEEVAAIRTELDTRILALEGKFTGTNDIQGQLDALDGRLDVIEGSESEEGSIAKALADAKAFATQQDNAVIADLEQYVDGAKTETKTYVDGKVATLVAKDAELVSEDTRLAGLISANTTAISNEVTAREQAIQGINTKIGTVTEGKDVVTMISDAQSAAISDATSLVEALRDGQVATNKADIAAMDAAYKAADTSLGNRITDVEGKLANVSNVMDFVGARAVTIAPETGVITVTPAEGETFSKGDVVVNNDGKEYVYDGSVWHEFGYADGNTAAIEALQGRMTTAEGDIDQAQADITALESAVGTKLPTETFNAHVNGDHAKTATEITTEITNAVNGEKTAREAADKAITDQIGTKTDAATANTVYGAIADAKKAGTDAEAKATENAAAIQVINETTIPGITANYQAADKAITDQIGTGFDATNTVAAKVKAAQDAADGAQADVDALTAEGGAVTQNTADIAAIKSDYLKAVDLYIFDCGTSTTVTHELPTA